MMTQCQYIKSVSRKLHLLEMLKQTVLEDLKESFDTAHECGESTESVIECLGTPRDFASAFPIVGGIALWLIPVALTGIHHFPVWHTCLC